MNGLRQGWLVAVREMRERSRSRAFRASLVVMLLVVVGVIVVPAMLDSGAAAPEDVGLTGAVPTELPARHRRPGRTPSAPRCASTATTTLAAGEEAVRQGDVDVLVVDARRLEWRGQADEQLRAVVTGAIQLVAVHERAAAAGISPDDLRRPGRPGAGRRTSSSARSPGAAPTTRRPPSS